MDEARWNLEADVVVLGSGGTLGPGLTFGYIAGRYLGMHLPNRRTPRCEGQAWQWLPLSRRGPQPAPIALAIAASISAALGFLRSVSPPFTCKFSPVMKHSSLARNTAAAATSSEVPILPSG